MIAEIRFRSQWCPQGMMVEEEGTPQKVKVYKEYSKEACIHACKVWGEKNLISHIKSARETSPNPTYKIKDIYYIDYDEAIAEGDY